MEPDVVRLYSSSPPPLDEVGEEEDEDEFGDFGGYGGGVSSSFSFSDFDTPTAYGQSYGAETSPPDPPVAPLQGASPAGKTTSVEETEKLAEKHQASLASNSKPSVDCENGELETSEVLINGVSPSDLQGAHPALPNTVQHSWDFGRNSTGQHRDSLSTGDKGICLSSRHSKLNRDAEEEEPIESSINSTETGLTGDHSTETKLAGYHSTQTGLAEDHSAETVLTGDNGTETGLDYTAESCSGPHPPVSANISQRKLSEPGDPVAGELMEEISDLQCNESTLGPVVEVSVVVSSTELPEDSEEVSGTEMGPTVEADPDLRAEEALREGEGSSPGPTVEVDDDFGHFGDVDQGSADFSRTDTATQEGFADFVTALSGCSTDEEFGDTDTLKDLKEEEELAEEEGGGGENEGMQCSELPQSDSFADFSSAPCGGLAGGGGESWAAFGQQGECESQHQSWAAFDKEQQSSTAISPPSDSLQTDNVSDLSAVLSCRLQHLFQSTFLSEVTPEVTEVATLQVLLEPQDHGDNGSLPTRGEPVALWHHLLDIHAAHGLKVQWVGSHSNRILLDSLGMRNILFTESKQPVIVPIFAAGLGMLEPTKDPGKPSSSPSAAVRSSSSSDQGSSSPCTPAAPSLSISEDGVDLELYELTTTNLESPNGGSNRTDAFNRLMETIEKTSTLQRKPEREGEMSEEASRVISGLPNLSFMKARVLMFPSTLTPTANHP